LLAFILVPALVMLALVACSDDGGSPTQVPTPEAAGPLAGTTLDAAEAARRGEALFNANCSACHGIDAVGTSLGPPLVHRVYHPGHHPDFSIGNAVAQGVPQHHWPFGDMAPVTGLASEDIENIICYVRQRQRTAGIFEGDGFGTVC
jgi:mono/diheme cytochrome c family protein